MLCSFLGAHLSTAYHKKSCYTYFQICFLINNVTLVVYEKKVLLTVGIDYYMW